MYLFFVLKSWVFQGIPRHTLVSASGCICVFQLPMTHAIAKPLTINRSDETPHAQTSTSADCSGERCELAAHHQATQRAL